MKIVKKVAIILFIALFCIMCTKIISIAATATIITETLRLRKEPTTDSKIVDLISEDEKVEIIEANVGDDKNWYKVKYKGNTGYVYGRYIEVNNNTSNSNTNTTKPNNNTTNNNITTTPNTNNNTEQNNVTNTTTNENNTVNNNLTNTAVSENNENTNNNVENNTPTENINEENNNVGVRGTEPRKQRKYSSCKCGNN